MEQEQKPKARRKPKDDGTITWVRPSKSEITTNSEKATIEYAEAQGWKRK